jgi:hypothetical protein
MKRQHKGHVVRDQAAKSRGTGEGKPLDRPVPLDAQALKQVAGGQSTPLTDAPHGKW